MLRFIGNRILTLIPMVLGVSVIVFSFIHLIPGDPIRMMMGEEADPKAVEQVRAMYNLDKPLPQQYWLWLTGILKGDFGMSILQRKPIVKLIGDALEPTVMLAICSMLFGVALGVVTGITSAVNRNTWKDYVSTVLAFLGLSTPSFFLSIVLVLVFAYYLNILPPTGYVPIYVSPVRFIRHMVLPSVALGLILSCAIMRMLRSSLLELFGREFILAARAKGVLRALIIYKHQLRNALLPTITIIALRMGALIGGSTIVETVFAIPGMGRLTLDAIYTRDYPLIQMSILMMTCVFVLANLVADILYVLLEPRLRYQ